MGSHAAVSDQSGREIEGEGQHEKGFSCLHWRRKAVGFERQRCEDFSYDRLCSIECFRSNSFSVFAPF
jgi:hypothetical protein